MTDDLDPADAADEVEEKDEEAIEDPDTIEDLPPPNMGEDDDDETDEVIAAEELSPVEGAEEPTEFDPEDPDAYLYTPPAVKYSDSAEEDERDYIQAEEF